MQLFIDTNIFLSFYHFTGDDLEELKKLVVLLEQEKIQLHLPGQVLSEFRRNRETKIADSLKKFKEQRLNLQFPQICKDYDEYAKLRDLQKEYESHHTALINKLAEDVKDYSLKADAILNQLFGLAEHIPCLDPLVFKARLRFNLGNPPGKDNSIGDALNWEALLASVPEKNDLHFITDDKDYCSPLDEDSFSGFLAEEWRDKKKSQLVFYKRISSFFKEHFPDIKLAAELEKDLLIRDLATSSSFARTHAVVSKLSKYADFTADQANAIVAAAVTNSQVRLIVDDADVLEFLSTVIKGREKLIDKENLESLMLCMAPPKTPEVQDDDLPF